jgi:hypothetical protein
MSIASGPSQPTSILRVFVRAWALVLRAPFLTAGILLAGVLMSLGASRMAGGHQDFALMTLPRNPAWSGEWIAETSGDLHGFVWIFAHEILGFGGAVNLAAQFADPSGLPRLADGMWGVGFVLWSFLSGGVLDRLARGRRVTCFAFFGTSGVYFFRFLRLGVVTGAGYWVLFRWVFPYLIDRTALPAPPDDIGARGALSLALLVVTVAITVVADYAKVRAVVEDRRSMIGALSSSWRFIRRRPFRTALLFVLGAIVAMALIALADHMAIMGTYVSPLAVSLVKAVLFIWVRLAFMASAVVFFQSEVAHVGYTASPLPAWPQSAAAEAIDNFLARR